MIVDLRIDLEATFDPGRALNMVQAAKLMRGFRGHVHKDVALKWATKGCRVGRYVVQLPSIRVGRERLTMLEWVEEFERARFRLGRAGPPVLAPAARAPRSREAAQRRARRELRTMGVTVD